MQRCRGSLDSSYLGPSLKPDPFPRSLSLTTSIAYGMFLLQCEMIRFMLHPLAPISRRATWNSRSLGIWMSYLQVYLAWPSLPEPLPMSLRSAAFAPAPLTGV